MNAMVLLAAGALAINAAGGVPVPEGLLLHLDAEAQRELRAGASLPGIGNLQPVDFLLDGSGQKLLATQTAPEHRPVFVSDGSASYLKFDGNDYLAVDLQRQLASEATIFVLAAPQTNHGAFTGMFAAAELGKNDYTTGLNLDFGPSATTNISVLNVESAGSAGFRDLLTPGFFNAAERPFGDFHVFTIRTAPGKTELFLDGFKGGERERDDSRIALDRMVVGARFYSNDPNQPPFAQGFFSGAIAEVLVYNRALNEAERIAVEQALLAKTVALQALLSGATGHALEPVKDPPLVQMFVPGFAVRELPLRIGNLNNVRYRHDGKLIGQGYDGRIYLLTDTDGDGLEDRAELFWDKPTLRSPIGIALTPAHDRRGDGVYVASKGKISLILDRDRDGRGDEELVLASGWAEPFHNVDTLGLAVDPRDGAVFFGFGCANFVDAYLIDKATGQAHYRIADQRGTIQRISPDYSSRETICTGVRFTCALAFNHLGDLFATDQEGATWLANGNPLDELLYIQRGKHYGFPPRHPKHLPEVRDEPAVVEYGPQHQSTVGLVFNDGVNGGPHFGPAHWEHDAIVCGESRGKLYRTKLAKTPLGYVGQNYLIASLTMLTVDAAISPKGDLVVACHSGPPDWGTGPAGEGRLFKIDYSRPELPQPVLAWAAAPDEFRIAFDHPLEPADWAHTREQVKIEAGPYVGAGDRFEAIRPGYQVVRDQLATPRRWVPVLGVTLSEDAREIVLRVPVQTEPVNYAVTLPTPEKWRERGGIPQYPQIDVALTLNGISAVIKAKGRELRTVLPSASLAASAELTRGSSSQEEFLALAKAEAAELRLQGRANLSNPFVPAVQPGSHLDWDMSKDDFASRQFTLYADYKGTAEVPTDGGVFDVPLGAEFATGNGLFLAAGQLQHPLSPSRVFLPWALAKAGSRTNLASARRADVKGNWLRGRTIFVGEGGCVTCHTMRGEGTPFGPDLSNLIHRDRISVLTDILQPSATINPDHTGSLVKLENGTEQAGIVRRIDAETLVLGLPAGAEMEFARTKVKSIEPMKTSLMPEGLRESLSADQLEDLLTFLLVDPLQPAAITRSEPPMPPVRHMNELERILDGKLSTVTNAPQLRILLCAGPKDHGPDEHDYPVWLNRWSQLLALAHNVIVTTSMGFPSPAQLAACDVAVFYNGNPDWDGGKASLLDEFHKRGGGAVYLHYAVDGGKDPGAAAERIGLAFTLGSAFRHGACDLVFANAAHPITRNFPTLHFTDETYWKMKGDPARLNVLGTVVEDGEPRPQLWTLERAKSRIVGCIPGHYTWTFDDPLFRLLVFRAICWAARQENVDRLAELSPIGARISANPGQ